MLNTSTYTALVRIALFCAAWAAAPHVAISIARHQVQQNYANNTIQSLKARKQMIIQNHLKTLSYKQVPTPLALATRMMRHLRMAMVGC
jgi:hypothetical protein